jgi:hypothetical protein
MTLEMALKLLSHKKNYVPQFLKQRDINSYYNFPRDKDLNIFSTKEILSNLETAGLQMDIFLKAYKSKSVLFVHA